MSIDRLENYLHTSLSGAGFVILDSQIACTLRPDLWGTNGGMEAAYEMYRPHNKNKIRAIHGKRFLLRLEGRLRDIELIARSEDMLERRIHWATGLDAFELISASELEGEAMYDPAQTAKLRATRISDDLHHGTPTAEPGRTCGQCEHLTANGACKTAKASGIEYPAANALRRCTAFTPIWGGDEKRTGAELWPELIEKKG